MTSRLTIFRIHDYPSLERACAELHDCPFNLDSVLFDKTTGICESRFIRPLHDPAQVESARKFLILSVYRVPLVQTALRLKGIRDSRIKDAAQIGTYTFNECLRTARGCRLVFNEDLEVELDFIGEPTGEFRDERILEKRGTYTSFWFIETGMRIE